MHFSIILSTLETAALNYIKQLKQENDAQKHDISMIQMVMSSNSAFAGFTWPVRESVVVLELSLIHI